MTEIKQTTITDRPTYYTKEPVFISPVAASAAQTIIYLIQFLFGILEIFLAFRFVFRLTGANPSSGFVSFTYALTRIFLLPFLTIFPRATTEGAVTTGVFEPSTLVAMAVYAVLCWGIIQLVAILSRQETTTETQ